MAIEWAQTYEGKFTIRRSVNGCWEVNIKDAGGKGNSFGGKAVPLLALLGSMLECRLEEYDSNADLEEMFRLWRDGESTTSLTAYTFDDAAHK